MKLAATHRIATLLIAAALAIAGPAHAQLMQRSGATPTPIKADFVSGVGATIPANILAQIRGALGGATGQKALVVQLIDCDSQRCIDAARATDEFLWRPLRDRPVGVVVVATGSTAAQLDTMVKQHQLTVPVIHDGDDSIFSFFAEQGVPRTVIMTGEGRIVYQHAGWRAGREAEFRAVVEGMLQGREPDEVRASGGSAQSPQGFDENLMARDIRGESAPDVPVETWINPPPGDVTGKYKLIDLWATWCGPCIMALRQAEQVHSKYEDRLVTMAISDEDPEKVRRFVKKEGWKQPIGIDTKRRLPEGLQVMGIPHAFIVNPQGKVVWQGHPGVLWSGKDPLIEQILNGREFGKGGR